MRIALTGLVLALAACSAAPEEPSSPPIASNSPKETEMVQMLKEKGADEQSRRTVKPVQTEPPKPTGDVLLTVDLSKGIGNRDLGYYLLRPDEWTLLKVEQVAPTTRIYTFRAMASRGDMRQLLDPLRPRTR